MSSRIRMWRTDPRGGGAARHAGALSAPTHSKSKTHSFWASTNHEKGESDLSLKQSLNCFQIKFYESISGSQTNPVNTTHSDPYITVIFVVSTWICPLCCWCSPKLSFLTISVTPNPSAVLCGQCLSLLYCSRGKTLKHNSQNNSWLCQTNTYSSVNVALPKFAFSYN